MTYNVLLETLNPTHSFTTVKQNCTPGDRTLKHIAQNSLVT